MGKANVNEWINKDIAQMIVRKLVSAAAVALAAHGFTLTNSQTQSLTEWGVALAVWIGSVVWAKTHQTAMKTTPTPANQATPLNLMVGSTRNADEHIGATGGAGRD